MVRSASVQETINTTNPIFLEPHASVVRGKGKKSLEEQAQGSVVYAVIFYGKKVTAYASYLASIPGPLASLIRHINDQIMPNALQLFKVVQQSVLDKNVRQIFAPSIGLVKFTDFFESVNDAQWIMNGGFARAYAKGRYFDIMAHVFLVPTNLMGIVLFGRDVNSTFMSFLGNWATTIGRLPYVSFVGRFALAPACYVTLCLAYVSMTADNIHKGVRYYSKISKLEATKQDDLSLPYGPKVKVIDGVQKKILKFKNDTDKKAKLEHTKSKLTNAAWDAVTAGTKLLINAIALGVLLKVSLLVAVSACPPIMIALACVAIYGVGRSIYVKHMQDILGPPKVEYEYMHV